jgi:hypothetical protein
MATKRCHFSRGWGTLPLRTYTYTRAKVRLPEIARKLGLSAG